MPDTFVIAIDDMVSEAAIRRWNHISCRRRCHATDDAVHNSQGRWRRYRSFSTRRAISTIETSRASAIAITAAHDGLA
jgi:hypothetical protein